jgi:hypothetical protein
MECGNQSVLSELPARVAQRSLAICGIRPPSHAVFARIATVTNRPPVFDFSRTTHSSPRTAMPRSVYRLFVLLALATAAACDDSSTKDLIGPGPAVAAKVTTSDTNPRANLVWADSVVVNGVTIAAGIRGDGRLRDGTPASGTPSNEYQGGWCGVSAWREGTNLDFKPNPSSWTSALQAACGSQRLYSFYLNGPNSVPTMNGPHSVSRGLWSLAVGQSATLQEGFGLNLANCAILMFSDSARFAPSNGLRQTRLPDVVVNGVSQRQWRIESQGSHQGACVLYNRNGSIKSVGPWYHLPFALTVTEVKYPFSSYP